MTGEKEKSATLGGINYRHHGVTECRGIAGIIGRWQTIRGIKHRLTLEIEGAFQPQSGGRIHPQTLLDMFKTPAHRQRRRGEHPAARLTFALGAQLGSHGQGRAVQHHGTLEGFKPVHPVGLLPFQVGRQAVHLLAGAAGTGFHAPAGLGQGPQKHFQITQGGQQGLTRFDDWLFLRHFRPGFTALAIPQAQAQIQAPFFHGRYQLVQARQVGGGVAGFRKAVTPQFLNLAGTEGVTEKGGSNFR